MRRLRTLYEDDARLTAALAAWSQSADVVLGACHGGLIPVLIAALMQRLDSTQQARPLVVANDPTSVVDDLEELGVVAATLPELERFDDESEQDRSGHNRRLAALEAYNAGAVLVANPLAIEQPVPDIAALAGASIILKPGQSHDLHQLVERLVETGYRVTPVVEGRGELAVRGGIIDVYPWIGQHPLRIEFFGDQVDAIRRFDAFSQESIAVADEAVLASASGGLATRDLWSQLPAGPVLVIGDLPLRGRLKKRHNRNELRFARQLEADAIDGASAGIERLKGDLRRGLGELSAIVREHSSSGSVVILARNDEAVSELTAHCRDADIDADIRVGRLSSGFRDLERGLTVVHDFELAERAPVRRRTTKIAGGSPLTSLNDLKRGDYVVHLRHGIGRFKGMATLEKRGFLEDFLLLEFAEESKLYVPVEAIDLVQKYVGASGRAPELSKIGGTSWAKKRARAEKAIQDMSADLLKAQASRIAAGGVACVIDDSDVRQFEAAFPYEETEDQLAAVREIKTDMERGIAMDRLLCGDVGFGKTEVAMRAAFKACASGYQVAVLVPTTLLAEQHLETFTERFAKSPYRVAGMNRFHSTADRREVLAAAAVGEVHVLIGTHAILTDKLQFARLGLLIVDEEHRFGVKQKEKLRAMVGRRPEVRKSGSPDVSKQNVDSDVAHANRIRDAKDESESTRLPDFRTSGLPDQLPPDVLTLSATPIPRTLHFSLLGLRDISVLAEAPAERLAVETRVAPWDDQMVRHAIERERERDGQLFVVHNRVQDLDKLAYKLLKLAPGLKLDTIHGQMEEGRIARVMDAFRKRELDCLVTTSIIESGIDIPNANTLFVNNAHFFGLAELHQIRGRIGRFTRQAFAYFLTPPNRELTEEARERLAAIQEYAELGAGFKLAMRDLDLRGAGNLLGGEQSGHVDAIGYELYTKLLSETVARLKAGAGGDQASKDAARSTLSTASSTKAKDTTDAFVGIAVDAYIPDTWLENPALKFELHKQLDNAKRLSDLAAIARSARDRYGSLAQPVARLFQTRAIRLRCRDLGIIRIDVQDRQARLHLSGSLPKELMAVKLSELVHVQLDGNVVVLFVRNTLDQDAALGFLCRLLQLDLGFLGQGF